MSAAPPARSRSRNDISRREWTLGGKPITPTDRVERDEMESAQRRYGGGPQRAGGLFFAGTRSRSFAAAARRRIVGRGNGSEEGSAASHPPGGEARRQVHTTRNQMNCGSPSTENEDRSAFFIRAPGEFLCSQARASRRIMDQSTK